MACRSDDLVDAGGGVGDLLDDDLAPVGGVGGTADVAGTFQPVDQAGGRAGGPYAVDREYEDLEAVIGAAGGSAHLFGNSGGGILALEAAARGLPVTGIAVWEPSYILDGARPPVPRDYRQRLAGLLAADRRGDMVELFLTQAAGIPAAFVAAIRQSPFWPSQEAVAHALVYDAEIVGDFSLPTARLAAVKAPTLVVDGGQTPWLTAGADAVAEALPDARRRTLQGQPHNVDPAALAPLLAAFFAA